MKVGIRYDDKTVLVPRQKVTHGDSILAPEYLEQELVHQSAIITPLLGST